MNPLNPDGSVALTLSSGPFYTLHADFWNTWQQERLDQLVEECLAAGVHCGSVDETRSIDWTSQFGTQRYDLAYATAAADDGVYVAGFTNYASRQTYHHRYDAFVRKYDAAGTELWTRQFGTPGTDQALALAVDDSGVYVWGRPMVASRSRRVQESWTRSSPSSDRMGARCGSSSSGPEERTRRSRSWRRGPDSSSPARRTEGSGRRAWVAPMRSSERSSLEASPVDPAVRVKRDGQSPWPEGRVGHGVRRRVHRREPS